MKTNRSRFLEIYWEAFRKNSAHMCNNLGEIPPRHWDKLFSLGGYLDVSEASASSFYIVPCLGILFIVIAWIRFRRTSVAPDVSGIKDAIVTQNPESTRV